MLRGHQGSVLYGVIIRNVRRAVVRSSLKQTRDRMDDLGAQEVRVSTASVTKGTPMQSTS